MKQNYRKRIKVNKIPDHGVRIDNSLLVILLFWAEYLY